MKSFQKTPAVERVEAIHAIDSWASNRAYLDNGGNYHEKDSRHDSSGPVAPWNATARRIFRDSWELLAVGKLPDVERHAWLDLRMKGEDVPRICLSDLKNALQIIGAHGATIDAASSGGGNVRGCILAMMNIINGWRPLTPYTIVWARSYPEET